MNNFILVIYLTVLFSYNYKISKSDLENRSEQPIERGYKLTSYEALKKDELLKGYLSKFPERTSQEKFFEYFPNNFCELKSIFGYDETDTTEISFGPLYEDSQRYIDAFFNKLNIDQTKIVKRVIKICYDGYWQADGISIFQDYLHLGMKNNIVTYITELGLKDKNEILSFWHFYYDGPHPENYQEDYQRVYIKVQAIDPRVADLMKQSYKKLLSEYDGHGH